MGLRGSRNRFHESSSSSRAGPFGPDGTGRAASPLQLFSKAVRVSVFHVATQAVRLEVAAAITAPSDCQAQLDQLVATTTAVTITGKNADRERAGGKV